eukprot:GFUD01032579.1.p1 GENE.GFUD01032579.1~~GFUD01032579.1.p1  ORF type:complete len:340 (-),score=86.10 GFUD01032579.1:135-1091(-)
MAAPNIQTIDLMATLRDISPNPTSDVTFTFVDESTGETSQLAAHKLVLACGSTVFMAQFYGPIQEKKDSIPVEDSTIGTFKIFLDVLYNKKVSLESMDYQLLGELFYLANKHYLDTLKDAIVQEVSARKLVSGQVLEVAKVAENHAHLEKFANALFQICSSFVKDNPEATLEMCNNEEVGEENSMTLHRLLARASRAKPRQSRPEREVECFAPYGDHRWINIGKERADAVQYARALRLPYHLVSFLRMKEHSTKGMSCTDKNTMVFVVLEGEISVILPTTQFSAKKGDSFYILPKIDYNLINEKARDAELFAIQSQHD